MTNREPRAEPGFDEPLVLIGEATLDRMPGLALIFEEAAANFSTFLASYGEGLALAVESLSALRIGELAETYASFGKAFAFRAGPAEPRAVFAVDADFRGLVFELLLGSSVVETPAERSPTRIEDSVLGFAALNFFHAFAEAFSSLARWSFERDREAEEAAFFALGPKAAVAVVLKVNLQYREHYGQAIFALPRTALDPFRSALARLPEGEGRANDEKWSVDLYDNIVRTEVTAEVKLEAHGFTLADIARFEIGDVLRLPISPTSPIRVVSEGRTLFWCTLGQKDGKYTVRLEEFSDERESHIENILGV